MIALKLKRAGALHLDLRTSRMMKKAVLSFVACFTLTIWAQNILAQAPNIAYSPSTSTLVVNGAFSTSPTNSGGTIPANTFGVVSTFAGSTSGTAGNTNATGTSARFSAPEGITSDASGNLYVADGNNEIREITPSGVVTLLAGSATGAAGLTNGTGTSALFNLPNGIATDGSGNLYVTDYSNNEIRKIVISTGVVTLLAGSPTGASGSANGTGAAATFSGPSGITYNTNDGALYVTDISRDLIRKVTTAGVVTTFAGSGTAGKTNATGTAAQFFDPQGITADASGNLYVADYGNNEIRKITTAGVVSLFAGSATGAVGSANGTGSAATFSFPPSITIDASGNLYVGDGSSTTNLIRLITPAGVVTTLVGSGSAGYINGPGTTAAFNNMQGIRYDPVSNSVFISDWHNNAIRQMVPYGYSINVTLPSGLSFDSTTGRISGTPTAAFSATTYTVTAYNASGSSSTTITLSTGLAPNIAYSPSTNVLTVGGAFSITPGNTGGAVPTTGYGAVTTYAGTTTAGIAGTTNGTLTASRFYEPRGVTVDASGNYYVTDLGNNEIRKITSSSSTVSLLAGSASGASGSANGTGTAATFNGPSDITTDGAGNLYVTDTNNDDIRKIVISTGAVTTIAGSGGGGKANGTGAAASFNSPQGIVYNPVDGALYVADYVNNEIRKVTTAGVVTLFAGSPTAASGMANGTTATFNHPYDITVDASGNLYVTDSGNNQIRKITSAGVVSLYAGSATGAFGTANGTGTAATFSTPLGITSDGIGNLVVTDDQNSIRLINASAVVSTLAGGTSGYADGTGTAAKFDGPFYPIFDPTTSTFVVPDYFNYNIRKVSAYGYTISPALTAGLTFNSTNGTISGTPTGTFGPITYTVTAYNQYGNSSTTITLTAITTIDWTGSVSTAWATGANWSSGTVPTSSQTARIGYLAYTGAQDQPTLSASTTVSAVVFGTNNTPILTIASGATLTATTGVSVIAGSTITIDGPGTINPGGASSIASGSSLTVALNGIISLASGGSLTNSGTFTLASDANGSASIAALLSGSSISGVVNVQRYITGGSSTYRGYRLLSSPVNISSNTSGGGNISLSYINTTVGSNNGALTGGPGAGYSVSNPNPTIYLYNEALPTYNGSYTSGKNVGVYAITGNTVTTLSTTGAQTTGQSIPVGNGYIFYFIGDNSSTATASSRTLQNTTLTATGTLNQGNVPVTIFSNNSTSLSYTTGTGANIAGLNQVGNPYASTISLDQVYADNYNSSSNTISPNFYELNEPGQGYISYQVGGATSNSRAGKYIMSGQGFMIQAMATGQTLTFKEDQKVSTQLVTNPPVTTPPTPALLLALKLNTNALSGLHLQFTADADTLINGQTGIYFSSTWSDVYRATEDALDLNSTSSRVCLSSMTADGVRVGINSMGDYSKNKRVKLFVAASVTGQYHMGLVDIANIDSLYNVYLVDKLLKDSVDLRAAKPYDFTITTGDTTTYGANRFELAIEVKPMPPYQLLSFTGQKNGAVIPLKWTTVNEGNFTGFTLQKLSGNQWLGIDSLQSNSKGTYSFTDASPAQGLNSYRLMQNGITGNITYSDVVTVNTATDGPLSVYPNPTHGNINISVNLPATSYKLNIYNSFGGLMKQQSINSTNWSGDITNYNDGTYIVEMTDANGKLLGKTKVVKVK